MTDTRCVFSTQTETYHRLRISTRPFTHNDCCPLGIASWVRVVLPPFPFDDDRTYDENSRNAAVVFRTESREGIHLEDVKRVDGQWRAAGENGMPVVVTGKGETMRAARQQCYDRVDDVLVPNCYYRDDIGERWLEGEGDRLLAWGYLGS